MFKKIVASLAAVLLAVGMSVVAVAAPAGAAPPGGGTYPPTDAAANDPGNWEVLPGETCYKIEPVNAVPYPLPSPGAGQQFSKVIVKAGSGDGSNLILTDGLAEGTLVQHNLKDSISHLIVCTVPTPIPTDARAAVTTTVATCEAAERDVMVTAVNATFVISYPTATTYEVTATADDNHLFSNGEPTLVIKGEFAPRLVEGCELPPLALVTPTYSSTQPTCTTAGSYTLGSVVGDVVWTVNGKTGVASGTYSAPADYSDVTISATPAVAGDGLDPDWVNPVVLKFTAPTGCVETPPAFGVATASVSTTPATCTAAESNVVVTVTNASFALTYPTETTYRVAATATGNNLFSNGEPTLVIKGEFAPKLVEGCELPSFALVTPTYVVMQPTCTTAGSYTLGSVVGDIVWTVNGKTGVASGTYPAPADYSDVTISATPAVAGDGLDPDWVNPVVLRFAAPSTACAFNPPTLAFDPPTLAYTGLTVGTGLSLAGGLLFVGFAGLVMARRRKLQR